MSPKDSCCLLSSECLPLLHAPYYCLASTPQGSAEKEHASLTHKVYTCLLIFINTSGIYKCPSVSDVPDIWYCFAETFSASTFGSDPSSPGQQLPATRISSVGFCISPRPEPLGPGKESHLLVRAKSGFVV